MAKKVWRVLAIGAGVVLLAIGAVFGTAWLSLDNSTFARALIWQDADVDDFTRFPSREVPAAGEPYIYAKGPGYPDGLPVGIALPEGYDSLDELLAKSATTAFLVIRDDRLVYENYFNGSARDAVQTSFSVAKSFGSALLGAALADGLIASADDPITKYLPELAERDSRFSAITIRHLVTMSSGLRYEEHGKPWSDDARTYYDPDLRRLALSETEIVEEPGQRFHYNNYNPLLFGMILERAVRKPVAEYLSEKIWQPMGAEAAATWSLDSEVDSFEKMESGINARAIDFAKLGSLYLHRGTFNGRQILPAAWVEQSTEKVLPTDLAASGYAHWWWTDEEPALGEYYMARGNKGQFIFIFPRKGLVIARNGTDFGSVSWRDVVRAIAMAF